MVLSCEERRGGGLAHVKCGCVACTSMHSCNADKNAKTLMYTYQLLIYFYSVFF